jgi:hypothetical protein
MEDQMPDGISANIIEGDQEEKLTFEDKHVLSTIARWRVSRTNAKLVWAQGDQMDLFGKLSRKDWEVPGEHIEAMQDYAEHAKHLKPKSIRSAVQMLEMALDILRERELNPFCLR